MGRVRRGNGEAPVRPPRRSGATATTTPSPLNRVVSGQQSVVFSLSTINSPNHQLPPASHPLRVFAPSLLIPLPIRRDNPPPYQDFKRLPREDEAVVLHKLLETFISRT